MVKFGLLNGTPRFFESLNGELCSEKERLGCVVPIQPKCDRDLGCCVFSRRFGEDSQELFEQFGDSVRYLSHNVVGGEPCLEVGLVDVGWVVAVLTDCSVECFALVRLAEVRGCGYEVDDPQGLLHLGFVFVQKPGIVVDSEHELTLVGLVLCKPKMLGPLLEVGLVEEVEGGVGGLGVEEVFGLFGVGGPSWHARHHESWTGVLPGGSRREATGQMAREQEWDGPGCQGLNAVLDPELVEGCIDGVTEGPAHRRAITLASPFEFFRDLRQIVRGGRLEQGVDAPAVLVGGLHLGDDDGGSSVAFSRFGGGFSVESG